MGMASGASGANGAADDALWGVGVAVGAGVADAVGVAVAAGVGVGVAVVVADGAGVAAAPRRPGAVDDGRCAHQVPDRGDECAAGHGGTRVAVATLSVVVVAYGPRIGLLFVSQSVYHGPCQTASNKTGVRSGTELPPPSVSVSLAASVPSAAVVRARSQAAAAPPILIVALVDCQLVEVLVTTSTSAVTVAVEPGAELWPSTVTVSRPRLSVRPAVAIAWRRPR